MKTKAVYVEGPDVEKRYEPQGNFLVDEVELEEPGTNHVHVDLKATGICHSDWHAATGDLPTEYYPLVLGHEGAGVVEEVGEGVEHVSEGDHVVLSWMPACGKCHFCASGHQEQCVRGEDLLKGHLIDGVFPMSIEDEDLGVYAGLGTYAEDTVVHKDSVVPIREDVPFEIAGLTGCCVATGVGAAVNTADIDAGDTVVHFGLGGVGANAVLGSSYVGADRIILVDPMESKREWAEEFGATHTVNPEEEDVFEYVESLTNGEMADTAIFTGSVATPEELGEAFSVIKHLGELVAVSQPPVDETHMEMPAEAGGLNSTVLGEKRIKGSLYGGWGPNYAVPRLLDMYADGGLELDKLITSHYELEEINEAYVDMLEGKNIRGVIDLD
jgi:S-(hydroxymethyl)glutathione dehydrogenase/alcohol dehydrogenase